MRLKTLSALSISLLAGCGPFESDWISDCEGALKYRLQSPSSYERISTNSFSEAVSISEYLNLNPQLVEAQILDLKERKPSIKRWFAIVEYYAANSYGAKLRSTSTCTRITTTGSEPAGGASEDDRKRWLEVDGKTGNDLEREAFRAAYQNK